MEILKKIYRKCLRLCPFKLALYIIYFRGYKKILNLKNPEYFGERIQWLKLYGGLEELSNYVDKYEVRDYVTKTIGSEFLNDIYGVYDSEKDIDFDALPQQFVIKSTNGSGTVLVCDDKEKLDIEKAKKTLKKWLKDKNYHKEKKEYQYKNVKNRLIVEKYLCDDSNDLIDYKFYCFNGKVKYYAIFYDRFTNKTIDAYSVEKGKLQSVKVTNIPNSSNKSVNMEEIDKMIDLSEKLSKPFTEVRVDFYCVEGKPIFGELTFTDGAGSDSWSPIEFDKEIGSCIPLSKVLKDK